MILFEAETLDDVYPKLCLEILNHGEPLSPRGLATLDLGTVSIQIAQPWYRLLTNRRRKINPYFLFAEFLWIFTRQSRVDSIAFYNKNMWDFSDDGRSLFGAYGPRLMWQIPNIINKIRLDRGTRQAVATIFKPTDLTTSTKDFPCNILLHFIPRQNILDLNVYVRSQDILLGLPYDFYHWSFILEMIATELEMYTGSITHICGSLHAYEKDLSKITNISESTEDDCINIEEPNIGRFIENFHNIDNIEFKNRRSRVDQEYFDKSAEEISNLNISQVIKDQLGTLLYYRTRKNDDFDHDKIIKVTGGYEEYIKFLGWQ